MQACKDFILKKKLEGIEDFAEVESKSEKGKMHILIKKNGKWEHFDSDCPALPEKEGVRRKCRHIRYIMHEPEFCEYCKKKTGVSEHHLIRRSQGGTDKKTIYLCVSCHKLATDNKEFELHLQQLYADNTTTNQSIRKI